MHPLKPYFLRPGEAAAPPADDLPEVLPDGRHRQRRLDVPAPHVLRDARQLLDRRLLQAAARRVRVGALARGLRVRTREDLGHRLRGRRRARPRPRRGGDRGVADDRRAARADRPAAAIGELLAGRPDRAVRPVLASSTSTAGSSSAPRTTCPAATNERFLEYWNLVFMQYDQEPESARSRRCRRSNIDTGLGLNRLASILQGTQSVFETDQFAPLIALGEELSGKRYGEDVRDRPRAADPRRPHARHDASWSPTASCPPTRSAATCCGA